MYTRNYESYMRSVLKYPRQNEKRSDMYSNMNSYDEDLEDMYPEIYKIVYPMVCNACDTIEGAITEETVTRMTDEIYNSVKMDYEFDSEVIQEENRQIEDNQEGIETRQRRPQNNFLRDLIRILLLRELLGNRPGFPNRPGRPNRPPFPIRTY